MKEKEILEAKAKIEEGIRLMPMTPKQKSFCLEYLTNGGNATKAVLKSYTIKDNDSARVIGSNNLKKLRGYLNDLSDGIRYIPENPTLDGFVYLLNLEGTKFYKIGKSKYEDPQTRLSTLQSASPFELVMLSFKRFKDRSMAEKEMHKVFEKYNHKREWFLIENKSQEEVIKMFIDNCDKIE